MCVRSLYPAAAATAALCARENRKGRGRRRLRTDTHARVSIKPREEEEEEKETFADWETKVEASSPSVSLHTLGSSPSSRIPNEDQSGTVCSLVATVVVWSLLCALRMRVYRRRSNLYIPSWQTIVYASAFLPHLPLRFFFFYYSLLFVLRISQLFFPVTCIQIPPNRVIDQHHVSTLFQPTFPIVSSVLIL